MARHGSEDDGRVALSPQHIAEMERGAAAALRRRSGGWLFEQVQGTVELLLVSGLSLAALWLWSASPLAMLVLLLATSWLGILGEIAKYVLLRRAVQAEAEAVNSDIVVWHVAAAMMEGRQRLTRSGTQAHRPGLGVFVDLVFGGAGTLGVLVAVQAAGGDWQQALAEDATAAWTLAAIVAWQVLGMLWMLWRHACARADAAPPKFAAGGRGLGLFVLVFLVMAAGDEGRDLRMALTWANGLLLAACLLSVGGLVLMQRETRWLGNYMSARGARREPA